MSGREAPSHRSSPRYLTGPRRLFIGLVTGVAAAVPGAALDAQVPPTTPPVPVAAPVTVDSTVAAVGPLAWSPVVSIALRYAVGSAADPIGLEGAATVVANAAAARLEERLGGPDVTVEVTHDATTFTVVTLPEEWEGALGTSIATLATPLDAGTVDAARAAHLARVEFETGAPLREFDLHLDELLADGDLPWARSLDGSVATVQAMDPAALAADASFTDPTVGVVGPVEPSELARALDGPVVEPGGRLTRPDGSTAEVVATDPTATGAGLWTTGAREFIAGEVINSWTAAAYPAPPGAPRTELEFLAHILDERLDPYPPADGVFGLETSVEDLPGGPVLLIVGTFRPDVGLGWEDRFAAEVEALIEAAPPSPFFETFLKRFRSRTFLGEPGPREEAVRLAHELARGAVPRALGDEISRLSPAAVTGAARLLGPARMLRFGPPAEGR